MFYSQIFKVVALKFSSKNSFLQKRASSIKTSFKFLPTSLAYLKNKIFFLLKRQMITAQNKYIIHRKSWLLETPVDSKLSSHRKLLCFSLCGTFNSLKNPWAEKSQKNNK